MTLQYAGYKAKLALILPSKLSKECGCLRHIHSIGDTGEIDDPRLPLLVDAGQVDPVRDVLLVTVTLGGGLDLAIEIHVVLFCK